MKKQIVAVVGSLLLLCSVSMVQAATTLMEIGRSPFHQPPLTSPADLITMVQTKAAEVEKGFALAGRSDLYEPFMAQLPGADIQTVNFEKGSYFEWMFYKKKGKGSVKVVRDVTWGNDKTFPGFQFDITQDNVIYTFVVPLGCGNVALMSGRTVEPVPAAPVVVAPPPNQAPQCGMTVSSVRAFCGEIITVDASGSTDSDGDIAKMTIAFVDDQGQVVSEKVIDGGLVAQVPVPCGTNKLKVTLEDNDGAVSEPSQCVADVTGMKRIRGIADVGYYRQFDPAHYLFGRVGLEYLLNEDWSLLGLIGGAGQIGGYDGDHALLIDALAEYKFASRYFVDFGVGGWITDGNQDLDTEDSQLDGILGFGARVYGEPDAFNVSLFAEVRSAFDENLYEYGRFGVGVRFRF